jgi:hypothetical protein
VCVCVCVCVCVLPTLPDSLCLCVNSGRRPSNRVASTGSTPFRWCRTSRWTDLTLQRCAEGGEDTGEASLMSWESIVYRYADRPLEHSASSPRRFEDSQSRFQCALMRTSAQWLQICGFCAPNMQTQHERAAPKHNQCCVMQRASERASKVSIPARCPSASAAQSRQ